MEGVDRQRWVDRYRSARSDPCRAVLEGFHPLKHALRFGADVLEALSPEPDRVLALARRLAPDLLEPLGTRLEPVEPDLFARLAPHPTPTGVLALARRPAVELPALLAGTTPGPLVLLERPSHLGNLGAAVRVAAAAGAAGLLVTGRHDPWHPAALRGSAGLHFALPVARLDVPPASLGAERPVVALDPEGEPLDPAALPADPLLVFGSERRGLSPAIRERADLRLRIPMRPGVSSLNLATSVAVVLYGARLAAGRG